MFSAKSGNIATCIYHVPILYCAYSSCHRMTWLYAKMCGSCVVYVTERPLSADIRHEEVYIEFPLCGLGWGLGRTNVRSVRVVVFDAALPRERERQRQGQREGGRGGSYSRIFKECHTGKLRYNHVVRMLQHQKQNINPYRIGLPIGQPIAV